MRWQSILALVIVVILLVATNHCNAVPVPYEIVDLGTLGGFLSRATGINNSGQVVGYSITSAGEHRAFLWENNVMTDLGTLPSHTQSFAQAINNHGHIVGQSASVGSPGTSFPVVYKDGAMHRIALPSLYQGENGTATAINDYGQIIGKCGGYGGGAYFNDNGVATLIGEGDYNPLGINNIGQVVGDRYTTNLGWHAFLYEDGVITDLHSELGIDSKAIGINDSSQITGKYVSGLDTHAFLYDDGVVTDLGTLGGTTSWGRAINNLSQIVGESQTESGYDHAFLYENGIMRNLGTLPGLAHSYAVGINDEGWIVGYSRNDTFDTHAVLWKPIPEPVTLLLLSLGGLSLRRKHRAK